MRDMKGNNRGFTIIELMIATSVLSVIILMVTIIMINIGSLYYKGISQASIQDDARSITDDVSKHLELGDSFYHITSGAEQSYCVGSVRYTFLLYKQIGTNAGSPDFQSRHVLWRDTNPTPQSCPAVPPNLSAATPSVGGTELMTPRARLLEFTVTGTPPANTSPYSISVTEAYGDNDLLCDNGTANDCDPPAGPSSVVYKLASGTLSSPGGTIRCRGSLGDQFCATATLSTTVVRRLP